MIRITYKGGLPLGSRCTPVLDQCAPELDCKELNILDFLTGNVNKTAKCKVKGKSTY